MIRPLRILLICLQDLGGPPHPVPSYRFWREYFKGGIEEGGHSLVELPNYDWAAGLLPRQPEQQARWRREVWTRAIEDIRMEHSRVPIDFVLSYLYPAQIEPTAIMTIKSCGVPVVNFFCDNVRELRRLPASFNPFSLHWVPEFKALALYRQAGLPHLHAAMPCWIEPRFRTPTVDEKYGVSFIGTCDELRSSLFSEAFELGWKAQIMGNGWSSNTDPSPSSSPRSPQLLRNQTDFIRQHGWFAWSRKIISKLQHRPTSTFDFSPHLGPSVPPGEFIKTLQQSAVCVGVNRYPSPRHSLRTPDTYSRLRDIEGPMAGVCYLTEWTEGIEALYELGTEIETYRNATELVAKSEALMHNPARRQHMREAGQNRALQDHSIPRTLAHIARRLNLSG